MGTECQKDYSDEDQQLLDEAEGRECGLPAGVIEREMPAIQAGLEARCVEVMQENARNVRADFLERLGDEKPVDIELLDLGIEMTEKEYHVMYQVAKELGLTDDLAIIDMPGIVAIKDPEAVLTEAKIQVKLGDVEDTVAQIQGQVEKYHMGTEATISLIRETMKLLNDSKIPEEWRDQATINNIVFVARRDPLAIGETAHPQDLRGSRENLSRSRNVYLYLNENDRFLPQPTEEGEKADRERTEFRLTLAHEIWHVNEPRTAEIFEANAFEWAKAKMAQHANEGSLRDDVPETEREYRVERLAHWAVNPSGLCPKMTEFFDKHFSH